MNRSAGSVTLFEPDISVGLRVQIMSRDNVLMLQSVIDDVAALNGTDIAGRRLLNVYIDCGGRASGRTADATEEAALVLESLDKAVLLIGFYSGVEVAAFASYSRAVDYIGC